MLPTPLAAAHPGGSRERLGRNRCPSLDETLKDLPLPTPTVCGDWNRRLSSPASGDGLSTVAGSSVRLREYMMGLPEGWLEPNGKPLGTL